MAEIENLTVKIDRSNIEDYEYLHWFRCNVDFGPAHGDVVAIMDAQFEKETGKTVPDGWKEEEDEY